MNNESNKAMAKADLATIGVGSRLGKRMPVTESIITSLVTRHHNQTLSGPASFAIAS